MCVYAFVMETEGVCRRKTDCVECVCVCVCMCACLDVCVYMCVCLKGRLLSLLGTQRSGECNSERSGGTAHRWDSTGLRAASHTLSHTHTHTHTHLQTHTHT